MKNFRINTRAKTAFEFLEEFIPIYKQGRLCVNRDCFPAFYCAGTAFCFPASLLLNSWKEFIPNLNRDGSVFFGTPALLFCFLFILTCSKDTTKPQTVTFGGTVTLPREGPLTWEGETDHSGVTVSLYKLIGLEL